MSKSGVRLSMKAKKAIAGYIFITPFLIGIVVFFALPIVNSIMFSFSEIEIVKGGYLLVNTGIKHYYDAIYVHQDFFKALVGSMKDMVLNLFILLILSFFIATLINQKFKGRGIARVIIFLPVILTSGVIVALENNDAILSVMRSTTNPELAKTAVSGAVMQSNALRVMLTHMDMVNPSFVSYITGAIDRIYDVVSASGVQILIFLAGLQSIPGSLFEASNIEGATGWENFWKITFPMISPLILVCTIYTIMDSFTRENNQVMSIIRNVALKQNNFGYGSAMAWLYSIFMLAVVAIVIWLISRFVYYYE